MLIDNIPTDALRLTWDDVLRQSIELGQMIQRYCDNNDERFDLMVVVPRGGYYPANVISRQLGLSATKLTHASVGSYEGMEQGEFSLGQMPAAEQVGGKNLLVIDEVCDSGRTLQYLKNYLEAAGANMIRFGVLHYKPGVSKTGFKPDWSVETTDKWIVYPWEEYES